MSFANSGGVNIWYSVQGEGDAVTAIGGDIMASDQFHFVHTAMIREFRLVSWDFRGIGYSDRPPEYEYSIDTKVNDLLAVLDDAEIERTHLWATATGTYTAIRFAHRYPERVGAVIHYGQFTPTEGGRKIFKVLSLIHEEFDWPTTCEHMVHIYAPKAEFMDWTVAVYVKNGRHDWMRQYEAELTADLTEELKATKAPMLVMLGDQGPLGAHTSYGSGWEQTKACRPDAELAVIEGGTGTYYMVDAAERSAAKAIEFFKRYPLSGFERAEAASTVSA